MKTVNYSLKALMLVTLFLATTLSVQAQGRGNGNGNGSNNPGRGHERDDRKNGNDRDYYRGGNHSGGNDRFYDRDRNYNERNRANNEWHQGYSSRDDHHRYSNYNNHRYVMYSHYRHSHPSWAPAYGSRYNTRYIYYQDYNVYYDCQRDVFLTWTGRNWIASTRIPDSMFCVDFRSARVYGVDYWDDDFDFYLQRRRPSFISISAGW